ncbi:MAG: LemA family protein [Bacteroidetes bacterium]|nr:LemA family protein [Bacteroidota bacterium]
MKGIGTIGIVILIVLGILGMGGCAYNGMVKKQEAVESAWSQVENVYQRRADLIPNLVNTVKGAANFEKETLEAVIQARASATQVKVDPTNLDPASLQKFEQAQTGLSSALSRLLVSVERYPELKANQNFRDLQVQLEGTENRITEERRKFNLVVQAYNSSIRSFPNNLMAGMFGFEKKAYFEAITEGAEKAPEVSF